VRINIWTIFPEFFEGPLATSILGRAAKDDLVEYRLVDLRQYTHDRHRTVDDEPYGGGAGMVMKPEPFFEAKDDLRPAGPIVLLTPRGELLDHSAAVQYSVAEELTLLCGHYKGVDERVASGVATEELSVGDYVLSGGEPVAEEELAAEEPTEEPIAEEASAEERGMEAAADDSQVSEPKEDADKAAQIEG
jgi:tRNA (guanine37-N1)-methyltransferase